MKEKFKGTGVALVTPFKNDTTVDFDALEKVIEHTIKGGVEYLVSLGTTGETPTLTEEEKKEILAFTKEKVKGRVKLVAGFGGNDTKKLAKELETYDLKGYDAILSASPYYNKPSQEGIYQHYKYITKASPLPIILYNVPGRTSSNISAETTLRLAHEEEKIFAIKEASGNLEQCMKIVKNRPTDFLVISGDDLLTLSMLAFGMDGVISVIANAFPKQFSEMVRLGLKGKFKEAAAIHLSLLDFNEPLYAEGNPTGIKAVMQHMNLCADNVRLPLVKASSELKDKFKKQLIQLS